MMIVETFADFVVAVADYRGKAPTHWRIGQCAYNLLDKVRPDLSFMVAGSDNDPFYNDENLVYFYEFLSRNW